VPWADQEVRITEQPLIKQIPQRWYTRPVLFVVDLNRALHFDLDMSGFDRAWHEGDGAGKVCRVNRGGGSE
jgi:hypothetical protein